MLRIQDRGIIKKTRIIKDHGSLKEDYRVYRQNFNSTSKHTEQAGLPKSMVLDLG